LTALQNVDDEFFPLDAAHRRRSTTMWTDASLPTQTVPKHPLDVAKLGTHIGAVVFLYHVTSASEALPVSLLAAIFHSPKVMRLTLVESMKS
jgi:hypothetical protein